MNKAKSVQWILIAALLLFFLFVLFLFCRAIKVLLILTAFNSTSVPSRPNVIIKLIGNLLLLECPFNGLFSSTVCVSRYQKGKTSILMRQELMGFWMQWHQLDHMQTICTSLQTDNHINTPSLNFYRPDALADA